MAGVRAEQQGCADGGDEEQRGARGETPVVAHRRDKARGESRPETIPAHRKVHCPHETALLPAAALSGCKMERNQDTGSAWPEARSFKG
jgi:hypothetical protein